MNDLPLKSVDTQLAVSVLTALRETILALSSSQRQSVYDYLFDDICRDCFCNKNGKRCYCTRDE